MFKVFFRDSSSFITTVFEGYRIEPCIEVALALHRTSNVVHTVSVAYQGEAETDLEYRLELRANPEDFRRGIHASCDSAKNE